MVIPALNLPVDQVRGIGEKRAALLNSVGVGTISDLLLRIPRRHIDRRTVAQLSDLPSGTETTVVGRVVSSVYLRGKRPRFVMKLEVGTELIECIWFGRLGFIGKVIQAGDMVAVGGKVMRYGGRPQMTHPEFEILASGGEELRRVGGIVPIYMTTDKMKEGGLDSRGLRRFVRTALEGFISKVPEPLPERILSETGLMGLTEALSRVHFPDKEDQAGEARRRLAFDELLLMQIALTMERGRRRLEPGFVSAGSENLARRLVAALPFDLTDAQHRTFEEIIADMKKPHPMNRLLHGEVGAGKTIVALLAALMAVSEGLQVAIMAPTEILADQHMANIQDLVSAMGVKVVLLVGGMSSIERRSALKEIASGEASITIGTHALLSAEVRFPRLALVIIDEQHRFGVFQRAALRGKGEVPDVLVMTATPIPRTLAMTLYGDLDVSVLDERPPGRKPVKTVWRTGGKRASILTFVGDEVAKGRQAYVVFPLVEASEKSDLKAATEGYDALSTGPLSGLRLGLIHGQMNRDKKEGVMSAFKSREIDVLISTTVVEVGVDVPNASILVVEHAERFGLPQLHQLRGRVGRGARASTCILIADPPGGILSDDARARLDAMVRTDNGFEVAEIDLELRGPGDLFGTRQSGSPELRIAHPVRDGALLLEARRIAGRIVDGDPDLNAPEHVLLRKMMSLRKGQRKGLSGVG